MSTPAEKRQRYEVPDATSPAEKKQRDDVPDATSTAEKRKNVEYDLQSLYRVYYLKAKCTTPEWDSLTDIEKMNRINEQMESIYAFLQYPANVNHAMSLVVDHGTIFHQLLRRSVPHGVFQDSVWCGTPLLKRLTNWWKLQRTFLTSITTINPLDSIHVYLQQDLFICIADLRHYMDPILRATEESKWIAAAQTPHQRVNRFSKWLVCMDSNKEVKQGFIFENKLNDQVVRLLLRFCATWYLNQMT